MDKRTALLEEHAKAQKKLEQLQNQQKILLNKQRDEERRARNHRLIVHGAILEAVFPDTASTDGEIIKRYHMDPRTAKRNAESPQKPEYTLTGPKPTK